MFKYSGNNSLIDYLKKQKLASKLSVGPSFSYTNFAELRITLTLTDLGLKEIDKVIKASFNYLNLLKQDKINKSFYDELSDISKTQFAFLDKETNVGNYISELANNLFLFNFSEVLSGAYLTRDFNETLIKSYLDLLKPELSIITINSKEFPTSLADKLNNQNKTDKFYGTNYNNKKASMDYLISLNDINNFKGENYTFSLRTKNEYITRENKLVQCNNNKKLGLSENQTSLDNNISCELEYNNKTPVLIINDTDLQVFFKVSKNINS